MWCISKACHPKYCTQPEVIEKHLKEHTGFEGSIGAQDRVCVPCYKSHLAILQEHRAISTDSDLKQLINTLSQQITNPEYISTIEDVLNAAVMKTSVFVGEELLKNHAILFTFCARLL